MISKLPLMRNLQYYRRQILKTELIMSTLSKRLARSKAAMTRSVTRKFYVMIQKLKVNPAVFYYSIIDLRCIKPI